MDAEQLPPEVDRLTENPRPCSYLSTETASLEYRLFHALAPEAVEHLLERGWRRFGTHLFRPTCVDCQKCVPIRVDVQHFKPSKSQRKIARRNQHIQVSFHEPGLTQQHINLYNLWHDDMTDRRGWSPQQTDPQDYAQGFLRGYFPSLHELRYFADGELVGVGLIDVLPLSLSSAYFYHAPDWRQLGPGTFSLLCEIELAKSMGKSHLYLGYWIEDCSSMAYKNRFLPAETLQGSPADNSLPNWGAYCG